jgi:hypothetical protein
MPVKDFEVAVGHTISLGNYEYMRVDARVVMTDLNGDWESARKEAQDALRVLLQESFREQAKPAWFDQIPTKRARQAK